MDNKELQVENGHFTRIVNKVLDSIISAPISGSELRIVLAVIRKTYGFQKKEDSISLSQLQEMTHISKRNVIYLLQNLEAKKILIISREKQQCNIIRFNKYTDTWVVQSYAKQIENNRNRAKEYSAKLRLGVVQSYEGSAKLGKEVVQNSVKKGESFAHTKERKKYTKETSDVPSQDVVFIIDSFKEVNPSYKRWYSNTTQRDAISRLLEINGKEQLLKVIGFLPRSNLIPYLPTITTPLQLEEKWAALRSGLAKEKSKLQANKTVII